MVLPDSLADIKQLFNVLQLLRWCEGLDEAAVPPHRRLQASAEGDQEVRRNEDHLGEPSLYQYLAISTNKLILLG